MLEKKISENKYELTIKSKGLSESCLRSIPKNNSAFVTALQDVFDEQAAINTALNKHILKLKIRLFFTRVLSIISYILIFGFFIDTFRERKITIKNSVRDLKQRILENKVEITADFPKERKLCYNELVTAMTGLSKASKVRSQGHSRLPKIYKTEFSDFLSYSGLAVRVKTQKNRKILVFAFFVLYLSKKRIKVFDIEKLVLICTRERIAQNTNIPPDANIVGKSYQHAKKNGEPDLRFKNNPYENVVEYGQVEFRIDKEPDASSVFYLSNSLLLDPLETALGNWLLQNSMTLSPVIDGQLKTNSKTFLKAGDDFMNGDKHNLLTRLHITRQNIKQEEMDLFGHNPQVVSDEGLLAIAQLLPTTMDDLQSIPGIGKATAEKWGDRFLLTVREFLDSGSSKNAMSGHLLLTLKALERKLIGLNRRNKLLYMPVIRERVAFDMLNASDGAGVLRMLLSSKNNKIKIAAAQETEEGLETVAETPLTEQQSETVKKTQAGAKQKDGKKEKPVYSRIMPLLREINRVYRETGSYDLYAGYPFVEGKLASGELDIKAPLALFPIREERTASGITLSIDKTRSVLLNTNFIYAIAKAGGKIFDIKSDTVEDFDESNFLPVLIEFYNNLGLSLKQESSGRLTPFTDSKEEDFEKYKPGELKLVHNCVLGRFSLTDTALQRDFAKIISDGKINANLEELITNPAADDWTEDGKITDGKLADVDEKILPKEGSFDYINPLNYSQEQAIAALKQKNKLVVFGPPGTGKSQTITSVIADTAGAGGNILMISEKKAALDVIYSRLKELSDFALIIDDVEDKQGFYNQLGRMIDIDPETLLKPVSKDELIKGIEGDLNILDKIADSLYKKTAFGVEMYKLIKQENKFDYSNPADMTVIGKIKSVLTAEILALDYERLTALTVFFDDKDKDVLIKDWIKLLDTEKCLALLRLDLTPMEVAECSQLIERILDRYNHIKLGGFRAGGKIKKEIRGLIDIQLAKYLVHMDKNIIRAAKRILPVLQSVLSRYTDFSKARELIEGFTPEQASYCKTIMRLSSESGFGLTECCKLLHRYIIAVKIEEWEVLNKDLLKNLNNYRNILEQLSRKIDSKITLTKNELYYKLATTFSLTQRSKKFGDLRRLVSSPRKMSLPKFISRFDNELFLGVRIWLATPETVSQILPLEDGLFDLVVFDEASQIYVERSIPGLVRGKKLLIAGDAMQLRPSSLGFGRAGEIDEEILEERGLQITALEVESLLDLAEARYKQVMLNYHYRSKYEELIAFSNSAFYKNKLFVSPNINADSKPIEVIKVENGKWSGRSNTEEANRVVMLIKKILQERKNHESIGIITFNAAQRDKIEMLLDNEAAVDRVFGDKYRAETTRRSGGEDIGLFVKNIENVQGDERDIIIFSVAYAPGEKGKILRQFGWLSFQNGENRLNVAVTRAKQKVYLVTSIRPEQFIVDDLAGMGPKLLKSYLEYAYALSEDNPERAKRVLNGLCLQSLKPSKLSQKEKSLEELKYELTKQGEIVDTNIGIGGYTVDLALKDKSGNYILGVEYDERIYSQNMPARERDYHRQKYLSGRGWKIYRLFGINFKRSRETEVAKIIAAAHSPVEVKTEENTPKKNTVLI